MLSQSVWLEGLNSSLMKVLQDELQWVELQQYTKDPHFVSLLDAIQNLVQFDDSLTDLAKNLLSKFYELSQYISQKFKLLIDVCILEVHSMQERALEIEKELYKQRDRAQGLQQAKQIQQKRLAEWEQEYETMKAQYNEVIAQLEQDKKRAKREQKEVKQTFLQVREDNDNVKFMLQNLLTEKITILEMIQSEKKKNQTLLEEIQMLKQKVSETGQQVQSSAKKLSYEEKRVQRLQEELSEKDKLIANLRQREVNSQTEYQQQSSDLSQQGTNERYKQKEDIFDPKILRQPSVGVSNNLADEMSNQYEQFESNFRRAKAPPDLYFAHYLLTVQSIKLKLAQEDLFPIDMSGHYSEMINLGTPFHQWDEWIKEKLQKLFPKNS